MKRKDLGKMLKSLFSEKDIELLQENLKNKGYSKERENMDYQNKLIILQQEIQKRYKELVLYYQKERNRIIIQHNQRLKSIDLQ